MPTKIEIKYNTEKQQNDPAGLKTSIFLFKKIILRHGVFANTRIKPFHVPRTQKRQNEAFERKITIRRNQRRNRKLN